MTDTEILDYLDRSMADWYIRVDGNYDMQIGNVWFTVGRGKPRLSARDHLREAIERDMGVRINQVTKTLTG